MANTTPNILLTENEQLIQKLDKERYKRLKSGLKKIGDGYNDWEVLMDMELEEVCGHTNCALKNLINPLCYEVEDGRDCFLCICGQRHLHHLTILEFNSELYILGSKCVQELEKIAEAKQLDPLIRSKIGEWLEKIELYNTMNKFTKCIGCNELRISKTTEYKDPRRRLRCNKCINGKRVLCGGCNVWRFHPKNSAKVKYYKECEVCYSAKFSTNDSLGDFLSDTD